MTWAANKKHNWFAACWPAWGDDCCRERCACARTRTHAHTHRGVCLLEFATTEGCSLVESSAALPDLHLKQATLAPPLLHPHRFFMSSSSRCPPPQSLLLFPLQFPASLLMAACHYSLSYVLTSEARARVCTSSECSPTSQLHLLWV